MKKIIVLLSTFSILFCGVASSFGQQAVSEEARRHMARGMAAVEMAKSPEEYGSAMREFQEASRLAPDWPDPHYNLVALFRKRAVNSGRLSLASRNISALPPMPLMLQI
jgi:hypothetical protein